MIDLRGEDGKKCFMRPYPNVILGKSEARSEERTKGFDRVAVAQF